MVIYFVLSISGHKRIYYFIMNYYTLQEVNFAQNSLDRYNTRECQVANIKPTLSTKDSGIHISNLFEKAMH